MQLLSIFYHMTSIKKKISNSYYLYELENEHYKKLAYSVLWSSAEIQKYRIKFWWHILFHNSKWFVYQPVLYADKIDAAKLFLNEGLEKKIMYILIHPRMLSGFRGWMHRSKDNMWIRLRNSKQKLCPQPVSIQQPNDWQIPGICYEWQHRNLNQGSCLSSTQSVSVLSWRIFNR